MNIFETIGMLWVIFTSAIATLGIVYLAYIGLKFMIAKAAKDKENESVNVPVEVKEMFKIAR